MKQEVMVYIRSEQTDPAGNKDVVEECFPGEFYAKDGKRYLTYEEKHEEAPPAKVTLKTDGETVTMLRHGALPARLLFQENERHPGVYHTPYGALRLITHTHDLSVIADISGEIWAEYTLLSEDDPMTDTRLYVRWEER